MGNCYSGGQGHQGHGPGEEAREGASPAATPEPTGKIDPKPCKSKSRRERIHEGDLAAIQFKGLKPNIVVTGRADEPSPRV